MLAFLIFACSTHRESDLVRPTTPEAVAPVTEAELPGRTVDASAPMPQSGLSLSPSLQLRIEGPSTPGECTTAADCGTAGCSGEVCVAASRTGEIITTCEILPAFNDLASCGCNDGVCTWTHVAGARGAKLQKLQGLGQ